MFRSIPEGLTATANMMFCIILIAGVVEIYKYINVVGALINSVLKASKRFNSLVIIAIVMIVFFIFGGILGWSEHIIPFVPIIISLAISLGYDALVGMAISGFACLIAFASAPLQHVHRGYLPHHRRVAHVLRLGAAPGLAGRHLPHGPAVDAALRPQDQKPPRAQPGEGHRQLLPAAARG